MMEPTDDRSCRSDGSGRADESRRAAFALATVVRTVSVTAAKAGAKAIIRPDGTIVGGLDRRRLRARRGAEGRARGAADGEPRLVSVQPENLLAELGVKPGEEREGVRFAKNMCPSQGTMDIFVEPVLPHPSLVVFGASPVAMSLAAQARQLGYHVTLAAPAADLAAEPDAHVIVDGFAPALAQRGQALRRGLDAGQGRRGRACARRSPSRPTITPSSAAAARWRRCAKSSSPAASRRSAIDRVKAPAGLDLGAITPEEIAMSILAEITVERRRGQRAANPVASSKDRSCR